MADAVSTLLGELESYYSKAARHSLPWRQSAPDGTLDPYCVLVSELMLQQTQVNRVVPKYEAFLALFPRVRELAEADLGDVLRVWQGLGYNRRAKFLWQAAAKIVHEYQGRVPSHEAELVTLPGVGINTARAVLAYAYNQPVLYLETNIRTVLIHHFFHDESGIDDRVLVPLLQSTFADTTLSPRDFYWAMMDYGTYLKSTQGNLNKFSKSYVKQSAFHGSKRQIRGAVLRQLAAEPQTDRALTRAIADDRLGAVLDDLLAEGLITRTEQGYSL